jgi:hypothetical protein
MKKIILTAIAVCAFGFANAQDMKFGIKGGLDMVSVNFPGGSELYDPFEGTSLEGTAVQTISVPGTTVSTTGFFFGGFADFEMSDKITLQPGLNYHTASKDGYNLSFLSIPVLAKYNVADKFNLLGGPSLYYSMDSESTDKTRFSLGIGGSYDISDELFLETRYDMGLSGDAKVNHFLIGLGYKL